MGDPSALGKGHGPSTVGNPLNARPLAAATSTKSPILADLARLNMLDLLFASSPGSGKVNENRAQLLASAFGRYDIDGSGKLDERELSLALLDQAMMLLNFHDKVRAGARGCVRVCGLCCVRCACALCARVCVCAGCVACVVHVRLCAGCVVRAVRCACASV